MTSLPTIRHITHRGSKAIGAIAERYVLRTPPAKGFSHSSVKAVLRATADIARETTEIPKTSEVVARAAAMESARCNGRAVASQDIAPIVNGGFGVTQTSGIRDVTWQAVPYDKVWVEKYVVWGFAPDGSRHSVPRLLDRLLAHPTTSRFVSEISSLADRAAAAITQQDIHGLCSAINEYRQVFFEEWGEGLLIHPRTAAIAATLADHLGSHFLAWKPPGAGAAESIVIITTSPGQAIELLNSVGWYAASVVVSEGITCAFAYNGAIHASAPQRIDLVGAADLGQNLGLAGTCCGLAVEPRNELVCSNDHN